MVMVTEDEFKITMSTMTLSAGPTTFMVQNTGRVTHALTVKGPGVNNVSTGSINPGSSKSVTVTLVRGSYDIYCPVGNHKMLGMNMTVSVA